MSDAVTWEDIQEALDGLQSYVSIKDGEGVWVIYAPIWHRWRRTSTKQVQVGVRGGGRVRHKRSIKARSRHFVYRFPLESNSYFTGDV